MKKIPAKAFIPTFIMVGFLGLVGLYLYLFTDKDVFWGGFISMLFFYALVFFMGMKAPRRKSCWLGGLFPCGLPFLP